MKVTLQRDKDKALIRVVDSGIGIADEHLLHLFTRFYRVDKSRARASGGIGLTISWHLVDAHGGEMQAQSGGVDKGSAFSFTLPIVQSEAPSQVLAT